MKQNIFTIFVKKSKEQSRSYQFNIIIMMTHTKKISVINRLFTCFIITAYFSVILSCSNKHDAEQNEIKAISETADSFVERYFNFDLIGTSKLCTKESVKWISFLASNITQEDINMLRAQDAAAAYVNLNVDKTSDTTATSSYKVMNFLMIDTLGRPALITDEAFYKINLVKRNGRWLVKMEGLPRSERQNHD